MLPDVEFSIPDILEELDSVFYLRQAALRTIRGGTCIGVEFFGPDCTSLLFGYQTTWPQSSDWADSLSFLFNPHILIFFKKLISLPLS
jgi:hypothetical protein